MNFTPIDFKRLYDRWYIQDYLHFLLGSFVFMVIINIILLKRFGFL